MRQKLFYFTDGYPYGTGEKTFVEPELKCFARRFDVTLVSLAYSELTQDVSNTSDVPNGIKVVRCGKKLYWLKILLLFFFPLSKSGRREIKRIFKKKTKLIERLIDSAVLFSSAKALNIQLKRVGIFEDADSSIYYTFWFNVATLACSLEKEKQGNIRIISRIHGFDLYEERTLHNWQPFQICKAMHVDRIIFLTETAKKYFISRFVDISSKALINPLGCLPALKMPNQNSKHSFLLLSCSNVIPIKRVELIGKAVAYLSDLDIEWIHFGQGSELEKIRAFVEEHNIKATLYGYKDNSFIREYYSEHYIDAFITTSSTEGLPVSIMEALSYGTPIIATRVGGIPEQVDGNGCLLSEDPSVEEVALAIRKIYNLTPEETLRYRERSLEIWERKYNAVINSNRTLEEIEKVLIREVEDQ